MYNIINIREYGSTFYIGMICYGRFALYWHYGKTEISLFTLRFRSLLVCTGRYFTASHSPPSLKWSRVPSFMKVCLSKIWCYWERSSTNYRQPKNIRSVGSFVYSVCMYMYMDMLLEYMYTCCWVVGCHILSLPLSPLSLPLSLYPSPLSPCPSPSIPLPSLPASIPLPSLPARVSRSCTHSSWLTQTLTCRLSSRARAHSTTLA